MHERSKIAFELILFFSLAGITIPIYSQTPPPQTPNPLDYIQFSTAGTVSNALQVLQGVPFPQHFNSSDRDIFLQLRDGVYNGAPVEALETQAQFLLLKLEKFSGPTSEEYLLHSRIAYYVGRAWNDHKNKKKAIPWFEEAVAAAQELLKLDGDAPTALIAYAEPLGELSILKDVAFLVMNGPKVGQSATKALKSDPNNIKALLLQASAFAYPPPIWGGNYAKALEAYAHILSAIPSSGFLPDTLFDLRAGIATAYTNLKYPELARWWFDSARELYPGNIYAAEELRKLKK